MPEVVPPPVETQKGLSQQQKIVAQMCSHSYKKWWLPSDFMKSELGVLFVGYEASARLSELQRENPDMFESRRAGKYMERRIRFEDGRLWYPKIPAALKLVVKRYYKEA